jgi:hypothetical protein
MPQPTDEVQSCNRRATLRSVEGVNTRPQAMIHCPESTGPKPHDDEKMQAAGGFQLACTIAGGTHIREVQSYRAACTLSDHWICPAAEVPTEEVHPNIDATGQPSFHPSPA